jgi:hypothetical protein
MAVRRAHRAERTGAGPRIPGRLALMVAITGVMAFSAVPAAMSDTVIDLRIVGSYAPIVTLPVGAISATASQTGTLSISMRTNWVHTRATKDSANIVQAGLYNDANQWKLQIKKTWSHTHPAQCRVKGSAGAVMADGPAIDVADGAWHRIVCVKSADQGSTTTVQVFVDGVGGKVYQVSRIGDVKPARVPTIGGRSTQPSSDSLDGWVDAFSMVTS